MEEESVGGRRENGDQEQDQEQNQERDQERDQESDEGSSKDTVVNCLQQTLALMTSKVDQMEKEVIQVTRIRSILKRTQSQVIQSSLPCENEINKSKMLTKRPRLLDAARFEAARRRSKADVTRQCGNILRQIMQHRFAWPFKKPVDVEGLKLHDYFKVIRKPMDLGTIRKRMERKDGTGYKHVREMYEDVRLVFRNAMIYNESWTDVHKMAKVLLEKFEKRWRKYVEPKLQEQEAKSSDQQVNVHKPEISEIHSEEQLATEKYADDVCLKLTEIENQLEDFMLGVLSKCRNMSVEEKAELAQRLRDLPCESLGRIVEILSGKDAASEVVQIDLDSLDMATLWRLHFFAKMVMNAKGDRTVMP